MAIFQQIDSDFSLMTGFSQFCTIRSENLTRRSRTLNHKNAIRHKNEKAVYELSVDIHYYRVLAFEEETQTYPFPFAHSIMICIGGVCVPYSAVVPLILMGIKWVFAKLHAYGLLPPFVAKFLNVNSAPTDPKKYDSCVTEKPVRRGKSDPTPKTSVVIELESEKQFESLTKADAKVVVKFTASWCQPCKKIHPFYQQKCTEYIDCNFLTVDVDDFDRIATKYGVSMMPTFVVIQGNSLVGTYRGSSEPGLEEFLKTHL